MIEARLFVQVLVEPRNNDLGASLSFICPLSGTAAEILAWLEIKKKPLARLDNLLSREVAEN